MISNDIEINDQDERTNPDEDPIPMFETQPPLTMTN